MDLSNSRGATWNRQRSASVTPSLLNLERINRLSRESRGGSDDDGFDDETEEEAAELDDTNARLRPWTSQPVPGEEEVVQSSETSVLDVTESAETHALDVTDAVTEDVQLPGEEVSSKDESEPKDDYESFISQLFAEFDTDHSGYIDEMEFAKAANALGFPFKSREETRVAFKVLDIDGNGQITEDEFKTWCHQIHDKKTS